MTRMNHELRTPLTAIIGFSRVLLAGKEGPLTANAQLYAERIRANGMHLLSLINQILDVAKVEAGRMELETETVAVDALVRDTMAMLESTAHAKGIALHSRVPAVVTPIVTDGGKLKQILINLIGNAIKFTNEGEVSVTVEVKAASNYPVSISVRDTGIGIAPIGSRRCSSRSRSPPRAEAPIRSRAPTTPLHRMRAIRAPACGATPSCGAMR